MSKQTANALLALVTELHLDTGHTAALYAETLTSPNNGRDTGTRLHLDAACTELTATTRPAAPLDERHVTATDALTQLTRRNGTTDGCARCTRTTTLATFAGTIRPDLDPLVRSPMMAALYNLLHTRNILTAHPATRSSAHLNLDTHELAATIANAHTTAAKQADIADDIRTWINNLCDNLTDTLNSGIVDTLRHDAAHHIIRRAWSTEHEKNTLNRQHNHPDPVTAWGTHLTYIGVRGTVRRETTRAFAHAYTLGAHGTIRILALPTGLAAWAIGLLHYDLTGGPTNLELLPIPHHLTMTAATGTVLCELAEHTTWPDAIATLTALQPDDATAPSTYH
jgi:hypothetical protein